MNQTSTFKAEGVLFDMDGTLTDSIAAVEAAWSRVADDLDLDAETVIAATHGKRAIDNLKDLKPWLEAHQMDAEVDSECLVAPRMS
jgi:beta-phosphoglucomutase-like phosphatase (HAD superfamily)